jgi:hypothetical protein
MRATNSLRTLPPLLVACFSGLVLFGQQEDPLTHLYDTGIPSMQPPADEAFAKRVGWTLVPEDKVDHPFSGDAVLLNDKLAVVLRKQGRGAEVYSRAASGLKHRASVGHVEANSAMTAGRSAGFQPALGPGNVESRLETGAPGALKILENNSSAVMVQATANDKASAALSFRLTTGEAILEIRSAAGAELVGLQCKSRYVVVPDYFGDDMVFQTGAPSPRPSSPMREGVPEGQVRGRFLPAENFCLHLLDGGDAIVMSVWESSEQDVWLAASSTGQASDLGSSRIRCLKGKSIWLAFLESPGLWHAGAASARDDWKPPFAAKWRCSLLRENGESDSWMTEKPDGLVPASRPLTPSLSPGGGEGARTVGEGDRGERRGIAHGPLLVYPIDRSTATPLTVTCPTDVMRNTLGVGPCQYILACEGLAAQGDPTPNAVMNWVEKQFEGKKERKAADDIKERLQVMTDHVAHARTRIERYAEFSGQLRKLLAGKPEAEQFRSIVDDLDRAITTGLGPTASSERVKQWASDVSALIGRENALAACQGLGQQLRALGAIQDSTLAKCRMAVRRLRQQGRTDVASHAPTAGLAQEVQSLAEQMLQKR